VRQDALTDYNTRIAAMSRCAMPGEWMKVMLEEIARKRDEAERGREEAARRVAEGAAQSSQASKAGRSSRSARR
jgi:hypothetical protein